MAHGCRGNGLRGRGPVLALRGDRSCGLQDETERGWTGPGSGGDRSTKA